MCRRSFLALTTLTLVLIFYPHRLSYIPRTSLTSLTSLTHQAEEDYDSKLPDGSRITTKRTTTTHWTFRGCVSGQQALDWQITGFNGFGFQEKGEGGRSRVGWVEGGVGDGELGRCGRDGREGWEAERSMGG